MSEFIAERELMYSRKDIGEKHTFVIRIGTPYIVKQDMVDFPIGDGVIGCHLETNGLEEDIIQEVYGVDGIQALDLAANIDPFLKRLNRKYNLYWPNGDEYFEADK